ncbi:uncharacterized protein EURHEDRAFT_374685 [Aspergillus ruber CBS 135680]|uniref:1,3-beta-glucanosyltransferase n=1 Tax=Aspergillus ruber (strain CBS 135680) TaxID=1388766 RepID=A0A017SPU2_ASPRC|nr:uncharacterized protein EURHEDRAFT_374685 [Aspergillus ruber CBS 135680]EYE98619.1 hypothetical protein EURHEDRAFT_374685 [Aspergillus ruber CBS 135680]
MGSSMVSGRRDGTILVTVHAMSQSFSGGLVYEYSQESNNYGLVQLNANGTATLRIDYENLSIRYTKLDMKKVQTAKDSQTSVRSPPCKSGLIENSKSNSFLDAFDLPSRPLKVQDMIDHGLEGARTGQLVDVFSVTTPQTVYDHTGKELPGIRLKVLASSVSNAPGENTSRSSSFSSSSQTAQVATVVAAAAAVPMARAVPSVSLSVSFVGLATGATLWLVSCS